jgi:hypothetical protein
MTYEEKIENLEQALHDARIENSAQAALLEQARKHRQEPSRLEIAAMAMQGLLASGEMIIDVGGTAVKYANALMNAVKEAK